MATMGAAIIMSSFEEASLFFVVTNSYYGRHKVSELIKMGSNALAFVQSTGLEVTIKCYGLEYDADALRSSFYRIFHVKKT